MIRALVLDFDGTIVDTETPEIQVWQRIFRKHGVDLPDSYWMNAIGRGAADICQSPVELLEELAGAPVSRHEIRAEHEAHRMKIIYSSNLRTGIYELISNARAACIPLAIASSSYESWVLPLLEHFKLSGAFSFIACADHVAFAKPAPDLYLLACSKLGGAPQDAAALEDSPNGIRAAKAAGLTCIAVPNPSTVQMNLSEADLILESASDIDLDLLKKMAPKLTAQTNLDQTEFIQSVFHNIVAEMQMTGVWSVARPNDAAFEEMGAFGLNTMTFEQWLRWVFVPSVESKLATKGPWPNSSDVGAVAVRNLDGVANANRLISLLCEFDALFNPRV